MSWNEEQGRGEACLRRMEQEQRDLTDRNDRYEKALREIAEMPMPGVPSEGWSVVVGRLQLIAQGALRSSHDRGKP